MDIEKIKRLSDGGCACCGKPVMIDGMQMRIVTTTESGQLVFPYDGKDESMSVMLPVCPYHMALAGEGWVCYHDGLKTPVQSKVITMLEGKSDIELKHEQLRLRRMPKNDMDKMMADAIKGVLTARQFSKSMKGDTDGRV